MRYMATRPDATDDELDLFAHKLLEPARLASRIAPMLNAFNKQDVTVITDAGKPSMKDGGIVYVPE